MKREKFISEETSDVWIIQISKNIDIYIHILCIIVP